MKIPRPKDLAKAIRKKARKQAPTEEEEASRREAAERKAAEQEVVKIAPPERKLPRQESLKQHAFGQETPRGAEATLDDEQYLYPAILGGDGSAVHHMLHHGRRPSERRSHANLRRGDIENANGMKSLEAPIRNVAPPAMDQRSNTALKASDAAIDHKKPKRHGVEPKVSFVPSKRASFRNAVFDGAIFNGASFNGACFDGAIFNAGSFDNASFDGATFDGATFNGGSFKEASFKGVSFKAAALEGAPFSKGALHEVEDRQSITTEDLNRIYSDQEDEDPILEKSKKHTRALTREADTSADGRIDGRVPEYNETSRKGEQEEKSTKAHDRGHIDTLSYDADDVVRDGKHEIQPHMQAQIEATKPQRTFHEFETPPLELNYEALKHLATTFFSHGPCTNITTLQRGAYHEIRVLHFEDGWACIGRFTRDYEVLSKTESELATIEYVRTHTSIPVPRIYFANFNENHVVGAPFVLMEYVRGQSLCNVWKDFTPEQKLGMIGQIANVIAQLSELKFEGIGCLMPNGGLGPLINMTGEREPISDKPFTSAFDFFSAFLKDDLPGRSAAAKKHYPAIRDEFKSLMEDEAGNLALNPPYRLIHQDFDIQNILVFQEDPSLPYKISGIVDWDWSYTGPLYYLFDYPNFILDQGNAKHLFQENKALRKHFVASLIEHFPNDPAQRKLIKRCFREKSYALNMFVGIFMTRIWDGSLEGDLVKNYLYHIRGGGDEWERLPYSSTLDWERDSDLTDSDVESLQSETETPHGIAQKEDNTISEDHSHLNGFLKDKVVTKEPTDTHVHMKTGSETGSKIGSKTGTRTTASSEVQDDGIPPLQLDYDALKHVATYFVPGSHGACVDITEIERGSFHEVRILTFEDGWSCIGRFTRVQETLAKSESELATIEYVNQHTGIPVPKIYFVNHNPNHVVGAAFVLMERMEGFSLGRIWRDLNMEHRMSVVEQIAHVVGELANLRFDRIGSLTSDGTVGPFINIAQAEGEAPAGPFNDIIECVDAAFDKSRRHTSQEAKAFYPAIKEEMRAFLARQDLDVVLQPPYRLVHLDFEARNILVSRKDELHPPKITGVIDWEWAFVGPSYYLYEYIEELNDLQKSDEELPDIKKLRQHFVKTLKQCFPKGSADRDLVKQCFKKKTIELSCLRRLIRWPENDETEIHDLGYLVRALDPDNINLIRHPYWVYYMDWAPDSDPESDDE